MLMMFLNRWIKKYIAMKYSIKEITISQLIDWIKKDKINLHPPYQRNFIWSSKDQKLLIDSIMKGYPLPNFFIYKKKDDTYDMVDGQQRATTISKYVKGDFADSDKKYYRDIDQDKFMSYLLNVTELYDIDTSNGESLEDFYSLVNKRGVHLNPAEVNKAQYHDAPFMVLVNELMDLQGLSDLDIFSTKTVQRMNDRSLIEELVAYLFKENVTDKRKAVEELLESTLETAKVEQVREEFNSILEILCQLNVVKPIKETRFKQRNDFYTLFCFIAKHKELSVNVLSEQYRFLVFVDEHEYIRPTNDDCETFKEYAYHCVTQSNSKTARLTRLSILEELLIVKNVEERSHHLADVCEYLEGEYDIDDIAFVEIEGWKIIDTKQFS